jgi:hypothetical protein
MTLLEEYGRVAIYTYLVIWLTTWAGFAVAISFGLSIESAQGNVGLLGASWVATKLTQPLRIAGTLAVTPLVAALVKKLRGGGAPAGDAPRGGGAPASDAPPPRES